jgi:hypothetical protein
MHAVRIQGFTLLAIFMLTSACASVRKDHSERVRISDKFVGKWIASEICEKHPTWPSELTIEPSPRSPDIYRAVRGSNVTELNIPGEIVEKDSQGILYRTIRMPNSYNDGMQIVVASIWKGEDKTIPPKEPEGISVILSIYSLRNPNLLVFEKYGYTTEERKGSEVFVEPYSKMFPKNYHCEYKRQGS